MIPPKKAHPRTLTGTLTGTGVDDKAGVSAELWAVFKDHAAYALYNPFVVALAAGTLKMKSLLNYLGQDVYYLEKYVEACMMAENCTDPGKVKEELKKHIEDSKDYANESQKWISAKECPNMAAVDYTRFLLATAAGKVEGGCEGSKGWDPVDETKIPAYTICSITPCSRLYRFLGEKFVKALEYDIADHPDKPPIESVHPYKQWIEMIFPDEKEPLKIEQMLDELAGPLLLRDGGIKIKSLLQRLYYHALNHEIQFFAAVPLYQRTLVPLLKQSVLSNCWYTIGWQTHVKPSQEGWKEIERQLEQIRRKNVDKHFVRVHSDDLLAESAMEAKGMQHISICIGDKIEDKEDVVKEFLEAHIGILIDKKPQPRPPKVSFVSLFDGVLKQERAYAEGYSWIKQNRTIYTVSSWSEIIAFLCGTYN